MHIEGNIRQEEENINTQEHSLQNHEKGVGLLGLWTNTIIYIKDKIKTDLWIPDQKALSMVYQLMFIQLDMALNIYEFITRWKTIWHKNPLAEELNWTLTDPTGNNERLNYIATGLQPTHHPLTPPFDMSLPHLRFAVIDQAMTTKTAVTTITKQIQQGSTKKVKNWVKLLQEYAELTKNPVSTSKTYLFVNTKNKTLKIKPTLTASGLYKHLHEWATKEPAKVKLIIGYKRVYSRRKSGTMESSMDRQN